MTRWELLLEVQEHDTHADQLVHRSKTLPQRATLVEVQGRTAELDGRVTEVENRRRDLTRSQQRLEDEVASLEERAAQADKRLYGGTTNDARELQALQEDIASIKRRIGKLEDDELEIMELSEPVDAELASLGQRRAKLVAQVEQVQGEISAAEAEIDAELADVRAARDAAAAKVADELWSEYDRLREQLGGVAIARLVGSTCQGCHLGLSAVEVDRIRHLPPDEPVHCEECGRLLVRS
jgi:uncharacterized protein